MSHFLNRFVVIDNSHSERNGQRAQVVWSRQVGGSVYMDRAAPQRETTLLTLRFRDGKHCEMMPTGIRMDADQTTPVWPPVDKAPVPTESSVTYEYMDGIEAMISVVRSLLTKGAVHNILAITVTSGTLFRDSRDPLIATLLGFLERSPFAVMKLIGEIRYLKAKLISADREAASLRASLEALKAEVEQLRKSQPEEYADDEDSGN